MKKKNFLETKQKLSNKQKKTANTFNYMWEDSFVYKNPSKKEIALHYKEANRRSNGSLRKFLNVYFSKNKDKKIKFLDLGCGIGYSFSILFRKFIKNIDYYGVDIHNNLNETYYFLKKKFKKNNFEPALLKVSMNKLPSNNKFGNFDMIWADGTLHHSESIETAIKNVAKVMKKSGYFIFWVINEQKPLRKISDEHFRNYYRKIKLKDQMSESFNLAYLASHFGKHLKDKKIKIYKPINSLGIKKGSYRLQELLYDYIIKFYFNKATSLARNTHQIFDWFSPEFYHQSSKRGLFEILKKYNFKVIKHVEKTNGHLVISRTN